VAGRRRLSWDEYASTWAGLHGGFDPRRASPSVSGWLRMAYRVGGLLGRLRVAPGAVTLAGLLLAFGVPVLAGRDRTGPLLAAVLVLLGAVADSVDGAVAVVTGRNSRLGYIYDSLADRIAEACWLTGFWLVGAPGPLVAALGGVTWLHEQLRIRAISAGMTQISAVTIGERPTRVLVALIGLLLAGMSGLIEPDLAAGTMTVVAAVWGLLAFFGLGQMFSAVRAALR
jgi:CDP-diacylglycerol--glycerol-3-phosphate 3-phosphatidyltransferase